MSQILYISSEAFPLIKTGGLGDVAGSLPPALLKQQQDVRLLLPAYTHVKKVLSNSGCKIKTLASTRYYNIDVNLLETRLPGSKLKVWLLDCAPLYNRPGGPYTNTNSEAWHDNALRFTVLCLFAVDLALDRFNLGWTPDIVHCNDWQTGLVPALLSLHEQRPATIFTIHNLAYQGIFSMQTFDDLHLPRELWHMGGVEYYGEFSFIKGGLAYADKINTVSPTYAKEILTPEQGYGLDGLLNYRAKDLCGILNGINDKEWNPGTDDYLFENYNRRSLNKKLNNKTALQKQTGLTVSKESLLIGMVSRLVEQKGFDIIIEKLEEFLSRNIQLLILGTGEIHYEIQLSEWASKYPDKFRVIIGYDEELAHKIEAASDVYLMPSTFEPCGLNQLYSLRYGTLPLVSNVGGLADTVIDANDINIQNGKANGFVMPSYSGEALISTLDQAIKLYQQPQIWKNLVNTAMQADHTWASSAQQYIDLYQLAIQSRAS